MVSPESIDKQKPDDQQVLSSAEDKQTTSEVRSRQTHALSRRWILVLLCILGIMIPVIAGSMVLWWPWGFDTESVLNMVILLAAVSVTIGGALLYLVFRTWWACLVAPFAWLIGEFLGAVVHPIIEGGWLSMQAQGNFWGEQGTITLFALVPLMICAFLGAGIGIRISEWLERRKILD